MKSRMRVAILTALLVAFAADAFAQTTKHRRPYQGTFGVTAHYDADGVKGNGNYQDYRCQSDSYDGHSGTDFGLPLGSTVVASAAGRVTRTNDGCADYGGLGSTCGGYLGNWVEIVHDDGSYSMYAHMKRNSLRVSPGDNVACGAVLGKSASSGNSSGPHLHYGSRGSSAGGWSISSTRKTYAGTCGRNQSLWTKQGAYQAAPGAQCENHEVDVDVWIETIGVEDLLTQGTSLDIADPLVDDLFETNIYVKNNSDGPLRNVELGYFIKEPFLQGIDYVIESDASDDGSFVVNHADSHPNNPPKDGLGQAGALSLYAIASGETKRVRITVAAKEPSIGQPNQNHPDIGGWVRNITDVYVQDRFGDAPTLNNADERLKAFDEFDILTQSHWDFDADEPEMLEGWTTCGDGDVEAAIAPERGGLLVRATAGAPCLVSPEWTAIDADVNGRMIIEIESDIGPHSARLSWRDPSDEVFGPDREIAFAVPATAGTVVEVELGEHVDWTGTIEHLRLEPTGDEATGAEVLIGSIGFAPSLGDDDMDVDETPSDAGDNGDDGDGSNDETPHEEPDETPSDFEDTRVIEANGSCSSAGAPGTPPTGALLLLLGLLGLRGLRSRPRRA